MESNLSRADLVQRIELMESMIAEGRRSTTRNGWIFVLWGLVDIAGIAWQWERPNSNWVWPVSLAIGFALLFACTALQKPQALRTMPKAAP